MGAISFRCASWATFIPDFSNASGLPWRMIHPLASVSPEAKLAADVEVGPFAVIDAGVELGECCRVGPGACLTGRTTIGRGNVFHAGAVIGDAPQDLKYRNEPTRLVIGDGNVFREHVTVHRSTKPDGSTVIGSHGLFMAGCHVAHNCQVGDHVIMANGALLGGHVTVGNRVFISGNCLVHQFVTLGELALMQGGAAISLDLPPYCVAAGDNAICGLNTVGLRRAGITSSQRLELRRVYQQLFNRPGRLSEALALVAAWKLEAPARLLFEFVRASKRGVCAHGRGHRGAAPED
jgi:UDP-N-acetylglucosamine acyltransferase